MVLNAQWNDVLRLEPSNTSFRYGFGWSVAVDGNYMIVDSAGTNAGSIFVFNRTGVNSWESDVKLTAADAGAVYAFEKNISDVWDSGTKIIAPDGAVSDYFGYSVAIDGDYAAVGAYGVDKSIGPYLNTAWGASYVFHRSGTGVWDSETRLDPFCPASDDFNNSIYFGQNVDISGEYMLAGAHQADIQDGAVFLFRRSGINSWSVYTKTYPPEGVEDGYMGRGVAISEDSAFAGVPGENSAVQDLGAVYVLPLE